VIIAPYGYPWKQHIKANHPTGDPTKSLRLVANNVSGATLTILTAYFLASRFSVLL